MRKWVAAVAFLGSVVVAQAGDGYGEVRPFTWTGFYVGAHGGVATGETTGRTAFALETDYDMSGGIWGGHIGYNRQFGRAVAGIEGTWSALNMQGDTSCVGGAFNCSRSTDWVATLVGRLGYTMDRAMVYGLAGVAWGEVETDVQSALGFIQATGSARHVGWVAGLGVEYAVSPNVTARVEYNHIDLGNETHDLDVSFLGVPFGTLPSEVDLVVDTIKVGVSWKFN